MLSRPTSQQWFLWLPVCLGLGIGIYFLQPVETPYGWHAVALAIWCGGIRYWQRHARPMLSLFITAIGATALGWGLMSLRAERLQHPIITTENSTVWIRATVSNLELRRDGHRLLLTDLNLWQPERGQWQSSETPKYIRLTTRTEIAEGVTIGSRIAVKAILNPPASLPATPNGYDFGRFAYFQEIGGVGFSIAPVELFGDQPSPGVWLRIKHWRLEVIDRIRTYYGAGTPVGELAVGILTGDTGAMPDETLTAMRRAGLGHLLAVSGLNMVLVMSGAFAMLRFFMSLIPRLVLRYHTKKIAAVGGMIAGYAYLLLTDMSVSAERAYLMVCLFFIAMMVDRLNRPMRPVAIAALLILLIWPESLVGPSFQMSFAAVIALIATFQYWLRPSANRPFHRNLWHTSWRWVAGVMLSTLVAGTATAPFAFYHFGTSANYSLLANLFAVPLTSFWLMPVGALALLMIPFGWDGPFWWLMGIGNELLLHWGLWITSLPHPFSQWPQPELALVIAATLGGLWLCLWHNTWRWLGAPVVVIASAMMYLPKPLPDIWLHEDGKLFALRGSDGKLAFSSLQPAKFARKEWLEASAQEDIIRLQDVTNDPAIRCTKDQCYYDLQGHWVAIQRNTMDKNACDAFLTIPPDIIVYLGDGDYPCTSPSAPARLITRADLTREGTHTVTFSHGSALFDTARAHVGERYWTKR